MIRFFGFLKPEYLYRPKLILRRLSIRLPPTTDFIIETLPWGMSIRANPNEELGRILLRLGIIDLAVTEMLWRLTDPGELAVDVGANIGYMTSVLAAKVGRAPGGSVHAFEAHPGIFEELTHNIRQWQKRLKDTAVLARNVIISEKMGMATLVIPHSFATNRGLSHVIMGDAHRLDRSDKKEESVLSVEAISLDELFPHPAQIGILKVDVEGHELKVAKGAKNLLKEHRIRDFIFEEHGGYPTSVTEYIEDMGYTIFCIRRGLFRPALVAPGSETQQVKWEPPSFIATCMPGRAVSRANKKGWDALRRRNLRTR